MHFLDHQHLFLFFILINNLRPEIELVPNLRKGKQLYLRTIIFTENKQKLIWRFWHVLNSVQDPCWNYPYFFKILKKNNNKLELQCLFKRQSQLTLVETFCKQRVTPIKFKKVNTCENVRNQ